MKNKLATAFCALFLLAGCTSAVTNNKHTPTHHVSNNEVMEFERNIGDRVFFAYNSANISHEAKEIITRQAAWLKEHPSFSVTVEGHADERGTKEYNIALGEKRATAIAHLLKHHGVSASRVETISYGKERPAVMGDNEAAWAQNRRGVTALK